MRHSHRSARWIAALALLCALGSCWTPRPERETATSTRPARLRRKRLDKALDLYEKALAADPSDIGYQMGAAGPASSRPEDVNAGQKLREKGHPRRPWPNSKRLTPWTRLRHRRTEIKRTGNHGAEPEVGRRLNPPTARLTPVELARKEEIEQIGRIEPPRNSSSFPQASLSHGQPAPKSSMRRWARWRHQRGLRSGVPRGPNAQHNASLEVNNATLEEALDYLALHQVVGNRSRQRHLRLPPQPDQAPRLRRFRW